MPVPLPYLVFFVFVLIYCFNGFVFNLFTYVLVLFLCLYSCVCDRSAFTWLSRGTTPIKNSGCNPWIREPPLSSHLV